MIIFCKKDNRGFVAIIAQKRLEVMSMELMTLAFKARVGNSGRKLVLVKLADNANDEGYCWPKYQTVADLCEFSKRSVIRHIKDLEDAGFLSVKNRMTPYGNTSNVFKLHLKEMPKSAFIQEKSKDDNLSPLECYFVTPRVTNCHPEPSIEPSEEPLKDITHNCVDAESQNSKVESVAKQKKAAKPKTELNYSSWPSMPSSELMADWVALRKAKRSPITQTVVNNFGKQFVEAAKHGFSVEDCLTECVMRGWAGFKCEWLLKTQNNNTNWQAQKEAKDEQNRRDIEDWINSDETGYSYYSSNSDNNVIDGECSNEPF